MAEQLIQENIIKYECECGSIIKNNKQTVNRHLLTKKHTTYNTRLIQAEQRLRQLKVEDDEDNIKYCMDEDFLKNFLLDGFDKRPLVKQILLRDCSKNELLYRTETFEGKFNRQTYYNERWFLSNGTYCIVIEIEDISTSSGYAGSRIEMDDHNTDYDEDLTDLDSVEIN